MSQNKIGKIQQCLLKKLNFNINIITFYEFGNYIQKLVPCITAMTYNPLKILLDLEKSKSPLYKRSPNEVLGSIPSKKSIWKQLMWMLVHVTGVHKCGLDPVQTWIVESNSQGSRFAGKQFQYCSIALKFYGTNNYKEYLCDFMLPMAQWKNGEDGRLALGKELERSPGPLIVFQNRPLSESDLLRNCSYNPPTHQIKLEVMYRLSGKKCKSENCPRLPIEVDAREKKIIRVSDAKNSCYIRRYASALCDDANNRNFTMLHD